MLFLTVDIRYTTHILLKIIITRRKYELSGFFSIVADIHFNMSEIIAELLAK